MNRVAYTPDDDALLVKYIATYNPRLKGRLGIKLYERLVENAERKWSFSSRHSVQSWRERYKNNQSWFDAKILKYQEKHGISANAYPPSQATVQSGVTKTLPESGRSRPNIPSGSAAPIGENRAKKRRREVEAEDMSLHPGAVKKMRRETVSTQGNQPCDAPPHPRSPSAELRNGEKVNAESSFHEEEEAAPVIGPDDYLGALSGSGESDQEAGSQPKDRAVSTSAMVSRPSTPANNAEVKPSLASRRSASPRFFGAAASHGEPSFSHQQHDISSKAAVAEASEFVRDSIGAPPQPSQEPTPPHTSDINSPPSPLQRHLSPMNGALLQPETDSRQISSISQERKRIPPSRPKRTTVSGDEDDIFSTPPPQAVRESPPPPIRGKEAPLLVEGPFRSAYTNSNGRFRSMLHVRSPRGTDEGAGTDGADEEWPPPRRGKRRSPIPSEGLNLAPSREREQSIANAQPQRPPSSTLYALNTVSIDKAISATEPVITNKNSQDFTSQISQIKAVPSQVARAETSTIAETSKDVRGPPRPKTVSSSRDRLPLNFKPRLSHGSIQAKDPAPVTNHNRLLFPAAPAHELPPPAPGPPSKRASLGQNPNPAPLDDPSVNDPFKVPLVNREARRWTLAGNSEIPQVDARRGDLVRRASVHHIDLRALHLGKSVGTSLIGRGISVGRTNTSESSSTTTRKWPRRPSRSSTPPNLSESNKKLVLSLGLEAVYSRMAENHKFHIDVVREVAAEQPSLEDADRILRNMRLAASREFARLQRQNEAAHSPVGCETGEREEEEDDDDNSGDEEDESQSVQLSHASLSSYHSPTSPVSQGRARRLALKIPMASPDPSPTRSTDYSPPTPTRARAFRRLEQQGRVVEARLREARHVRRSLQSSSAEASPEANEQRITTYLLQLREDKDGVPLEMPRNTSGPECFGEQDGEDETQEDGGGVGRSISPGLEEGHADADTRQFQGNGTAEDDRDPANMVIDPVRDQEVSDDALPSPLGHDLLNSPRFFDVDGSYVTKPMLSRRPELEDEDADTAEVEQQVDADSDCQTLSDPQAMSPEAELHMDSTGVDDGVIAANGRQSPPGNVLTGEIGQYGFPLDKKYVEKATSSLACSALATLSVLDAEWTNSDDELLLDGNLTEHEGLARRKGVCSVKFRTAHLYSLLLDG